MATVPILRLRPVIAIATNWGAIRSPPVAATTASRSKCAHSQLHRPPLPPRARQAFAALSPFYPTTTSQDSSPETGIVTDICSLENPASPSAEADASFARSFRRRPTVQTRFARGSPCMPDRRCFLPLRSSPSPHILHTAAVFSEQVSDHCSQINSARTRRCAVPTSMLASRTTSCND